MHGADIAARAVGDNGDGFAVDDDVEVDRAGWRFAAKQPAGAAVLVELFESADKARGEASGAGRDDCPRCAMPELDAVFAAVKAAFGQRLGEAETAIGDPMPLELGPQPVGGGRAHRMAI